MSSGFQKKDEGKEKVQVKLEHVEVSASDNFKFFLEVKIEIRI